MKKIYNNNELDVLVTLLNNNKVICVPTDTIYGLCSRIDSKEAYNNLSNIKKDHQINLFQLCVLI